MNPTKFNLNSNLDQEPVGLLLVNQPSLITIYKIFKLVHRQYEQYFFLIHVGVWASLRTPRLILIDSKVNDHVSFQ